MKNMLLKRQMESKYTPFLMRNYTAKQNRNSGIYGNSCSLRKFKKQRTLAEIGKEVNSVYRQHQYSYVTARLTFARSIMFPFKDTTIRVNIGIVQ